jgi:hypothetical protein
MTSTILASVLVFQGIISQGTVSIASIASAMDATQVHERTASVGAADFLVRYEVWVNRSVFVPATYPAGQPHYDAKITVYRKDGNSLIAVGDSFDGKWTPDGCFEDDPKTLTEAALVAVTKQKEKR